MAFKSKNSVLYKRRNLFRVLVFALIFFGLLFVSNRMWVTEISASSEITVVGVNNPDLTHYHPLTGIMCSEDVYNIQMALLHPAFDTVVLEGEFFLNMESLYDRGVTIIFPKTIRGVADTTPDGKPVTKITNTGAWGAFVIAYTDGVMIRDLHIVTEGYGIEAFYCYGDDPITIKDNLIELDTIFYDYSYCIRVSQFDCPVYISNNDLHVIDYGFFLTWADAIWVDAFQPVPDVIPNQHEVMISENLVICTSPIDTFGGRIRVGHSSSGLNNAIVKNNVMTGNAFIGIEVSPYSSDCAVYNNDLSGLTTTHSQISLYGSNTICTQNVLGQVLAGPLIPISTGIEVVSVNMHPPWTPAWHTENNILIHNDFRKTGLDGWSFGTEGEVLSYGCVVVCDIESVLGASQFGISGLSCRNNLVFETGRFPVGTGTAAKQVWLVDSELVYNNRVIGLPPCNVETRGIGQLIQISQDFMDALLIHISSDSISAMKVNALSAFFSGG